MSTAPSAAPTPLAARVRDRSGWRRALAVDLRLQRGTWLATLALAALALVLAPIAGDLLSSAVPLWAALAWFRYGRGDTPARHVLRTRLGVGPADRIRGRTVLVGIESAVLLAVGAAGAGIGRALGHDSLAPSAPMRVALDPTAVQWDAVLGLGLGMIVLPVTAMIIGGECTLRRPGWGMLPLSVIAYLGASVLVVLLLGLVLLPMVLAGVGSEILLYTGVNLAAVAGALLLLRSRVRAWIDALDGPDPREPAV